MQIDAVQARIQTITTVTYLQLRDGWLAGRGGFGADTQNSCARFDFTVLDESSIYRKATIEPTATVNTIADIDAATLSAALVKPVAAAAPGVEPVTVPFPVPFEPPLAEAFAVASLPPPLCRFATITFSALKSWPRPYVPSH